MSVFGTDAYRYLTTAEQKWSSLISDAKNNILVKSLVVPISNIMSDSDIPRRYVQSTSVEGPFRHGIQAAYDARRNLPLSGDYVRYAVQPSVEQRLVCAAYADAETSLTPRAGSVPIKPRTAAARTGARHGLRSVRSPSAR